MSEKKIEPGQTFWWDLGFRLNAYKNMYTRLGAFRQAPSTVLPYFTAGPDPSVPRL